MTASLKLLEKEIKRLEAKYNQIRDKVFKNHYEDAMRISDEIRNLPSFDSKSMTGQQMIDLADKMQGLIKKRDACFKKAKFQQKHTPKWEAQMDKINEDLYQLRATKHTEVLRIEARV